MDEPVSGGTILIYDGLDLIQTEPNHNFYNGTFSVQLNPLVTKLLASRDLRVEVMANPSGSMAPGSSATLMAELHHFNPDSQVLFINPVTTVISAYRKVKPTASLDEASRKVADTLGVASAASVACQSSHSSDFNNGAFISESQSQGGFDALVHAVAQNAARGEGSSFISKAMAGSADLPDFKKLFLALANDLAKQALTTVPFGTAFAGWVLDQVFSAPSQTTADKDMIAPQLKKIGQQLDNILAGISDLSAQIADFEASIKNAVKLSAYQQQAQDIQTSINSLCNIEGQVTFLADADPNEDHTSYAENVQTEIQDDVSKNLLDIWSGLEGNDSLAVPGLINRWSDLVGPGPGYPIFTNSAYLTTAAPNWEYYLGAETVGFNLQLELAHVLLKKEPSLAGEIIKSAMANFNNHTDTEERRIAHDREIGGTNTTGLFAAVVQPSGFNAWTIDTRSGLMWMLRSSCKGADCQFAAYDKDGGWGSDISLAPAFISDLTASLFNQFPNLLLNFQWPSRDQWASLIDNPPKPGTKPVDWLNSMGFGLDQFTNLSYWTSDVARQSPGKPMLFPDWANWLVDLRVVDPNGGQFWWQINGTSNPQGIANLLLASGAPLANPNQLLYRSMQDALSVNSFAAGPSMTVARYGATATLLPNGKVLIAGGGNGGGVLRSTELYDPLTNSFVSSPPMNAEHASATATLLPNGKVLIAGGDNSRNIVDSTELYDPATNSFAASSPSMNSARRGATATLLPNGKVLIAGGCCDIHNDTALNSTELYDPATNSFAASTPSMNSARVEATATLLPNGKVLIAGGHNYKDDVIADVFNSTELYDPATNSFATSATPSMSVPRYGATATWLPNGKVLIAGGTDSNGAWSSTELYDPATNKFTASASMNAAREFATATLLSNGNVLIANGYGKSGALSTTETYDPDTNTFAAAATTPSMSAARVYATVTLLPNSIVLVAGGGGFSSGDGLSSTELYTQ
jgi:hypothetical protein